MYDLLPAALTSTQASACLADLQAQIARGTCAPHTFASLRQLLEALPLDTATFAVACNRLANARAYSQVGEFGAANYELRLLAQSMTR